MKGYAEDPQFSQFYSIPMYLNPAFVGNTTQGRFIGNYRNQWPAIPKAFVSYAFSYDHNISDFNSGVGFFALHDKVGTAGLKFNSIGGLYAYSVQVSRKLVFKPGIRASYVWRGIDAGSLIFPSQMKGTVAATLPPGISESNQYMDFSAGGLLYSKDFWVGMSADHINQPNQTLLEGGTGRLPAKFSVHGGYKIPVQKNLKGQSNTNVTVAFNYKAQRQWDQFDVGAYYVQEPLVLGMWYRGIPFLKSYNGALNNDAIIALVGFQAKDFRIGYSYDLTISRLITNSGGSHEISITYEYATAQKRKKKRRQKFLVPCAKF